MDVELHPAATVVAHTSAAKSVPHLDRRRGGLNSVNDKRNRAIVRLPCYEGRSISRPRRPAARADPTTLARVLHELIDRIGPPRSIQRKTNAKALTVRVVPGQLHRSHRRQGRTTRSRPATRERVSPGHRGRWFASVGFTLDPPGRPYLNGGCVAGLRASAGADRFDAFVDYYRARLSEDPHLWAMTLFDEIVALGFDRSYYDALPPHPVPIFPRPLLHVSQATGQQPALCQRG